MQESEYTHRTYSFYTGVDSWDDAVRLDRRDGLAGFKRLLRTGI
jgi:hypothetical protein